MIPASQPHPAFILPIPLQPPRKPSSSLLNSPTPHTHLRPHRRSRLHPPTITATAASKTSNPPPPSQSNFTWQTLDGCELLSSPTLPAAIVLFAGGLGAGSAPRTLYGTFLQRVAETANVAIIAMPVPPSFDHTVLARETAVRASHAVRHMILRYDVPWLPVFAMGHSLGAKIVLLSCCDEEARGSLGPVVANMFLSFNNYSARQSIPVFDTLAEYSASGLNRAVDFLQSMDFGEMLGNNVADDVLRKVGSTFSSLSTGLSSGEFTPSPKDALLLIENKYNVRDNLAIRFSRDSLDETETLVKVLRDRFGERGCVCRKLDGTHVTPLTPKFGDGIGDAFSGVGNEDIERELRRAAGYVEGEMDAAVVVVVAFLRLHLEVLAERRMLG